MIVGLWRFDWTFGEKSVVVFPEECGLGRPGRRSAASASQYCSAAASMFEVTRSMAFMFVR